MDYSPVTGFAQGLATLAYPSTQSPRLAPVLPVLGFLLALDCWPCCTRRAGLGCWAGAGAAGRTRRAGLLAVLGFLLALGWVSLAGMEPPSPSDGNEGK